MALIRAIIFRNDMGLTTTKMLNLVSQATCDFMKTYMDLKMIPPHAVSWSIHCSDQDMFYLWFADPIQRNVIKLCNGSTILLDLQERCQLQEIPFVFMTEFMHNKSEKKDVVGICIGPASDKMLEPMLRDMNSLR